MRRSATGHEARPRAVERARELGGLGEARLQSRLYLGRRVDARVVAQVLVDLPEVKERLQPNLAKSAEFTRLLNRSWTKFVTGR